MAQFPDLTVVVGKVRTKIPLLKPAYSAGVGRGFTNLWRHWYNSAIPPAIDAAEAIARSTALSDDNYKRCKESAKQIRAKSLEYQVWKRTEFKARIGV